jgi:hypothetical protein
MEGLVNETTQLLSTVLSALTLVTLVLVVAQGKPSRELDKGHRWLWRSAQFVTCLSLLALLGAATEDHGPGFWHGIQAPITILLFALPPAALYATAFKVTPAAGPNGAVFRVMPMTWVGLAAAFAILLYFLAGAQMEQARMQQTRLREAVHRLESTMGSKGPTTVTPDPFGSGDVGKLSAKDAQSAARFFDQITDARVAASARYRQFQQEIQALELQTTLSAPTLTSARGLSEAAHKLDAWSSTLDGYEHLTQAADDLRAKLIQMNIPQAPMILARYDNARRETDKRDAHFFQIERAALDEERSLNAFMSDRLGHVRTTDGKLLFEKNSDLDTYNGHLKRLQTLAQQESAIVTQVAEHDEQTRQDLANEAR